MRSLSSASSVFRLSRGMLLLLLVALTALTDSAVSTPLSSVSAAIEAEAALAISRDRCTAIAVSPGASVDGSTMTTHTDDCFECDWRFNKVPAMDWPEGSLRPVYLVRAQYPRQVREDRGTTWAMANLDSGEAPEGVTFADEGDENNVRERVDVADSTNTALESVAAAVHPGVKGSTAVNTEQQVRVAKLRDAWKERLHKEILGYIPQVPHTYAMIEGNYGIMNEHQVAIGESTCASKLYAAPLGHSSKPSDPAYPLGKALLEMSELTQLGLERGATAREAVEVMGSLAVQFGFYGADWSIEEGVGGAMGEGGEAVTVVDKTEAWVFHILPDPTGASAVWVAQRVPDGHIAAVANMFVIREVDESARGRDFLYSDNLHDVAESMGWWKRADGKPLNFLKAYSPQRYHPSYAHRRIWRVFSMFAPSLKLPETTNGYADDYPFSVAVEKGHAVSVADMMDIQRDHYAGTPSSLTEGMAAGPYGDPNRYDAAPTDGMSGFDVIQGEFPRAISLFRTSYSLVANPRKDKPDALSLVWLSQYAPDISSYTPMYVGAKTLPKAWTTGSMHRYDPSCSWWNFASVGNYAAKWYKYAIVSVRQVQGDLLKHALAAQKLVEQKVEALLAEDGKSQNKGRARQLSKNKKAKKHHDDDDDDSVDDDSTSTSVTPANAVNPRVVSLLTDFTLQQGAAVSESYRRLFHLLLTMFRDGMVVHDLDKPALAYDKKFYPRWWLEAVGYFNGKPNQDPDAIMFQASPVRTGTADAEQDSSNIKELQLQHQYLEQQKEQQAGVPAHATEVIQAKAPAYKAAPESGSSSAEAYLLSVLLSLSLGAAAGFCYARATEPAQGKSSVASMLGSRFGSAFGYGGISGGKGAYQPIDGADEADLRMLPFSVHHSGSDKAAATSGNI